MHRSVRPKNVGTSTCIVAPLMKCFLRVAPECNWVFVSPWRDEPFQMKALNRTNGGHTVSVSAPCSTPSSPSHPIGMPHRPRAAYPSPGSKQSPAHKPQAGAVKKVTGVGGTTYEISVWIAMATMGKKAICWMIICFEHSLEMCSTWDWQTRGQWGLLLWRGNHFELNRTKGYFG